MICYAEHTSKRLKFPSVCKYYIQLVKEQNGSFVKYVERPSCEKVEKEPLLAGVLQLQL